MEQETKRVIIEKKYGEYSVKICFAEQDIPDAEDRLLDLIMQAYLQRVMQSEV